MGFRSGIRKKLIPDLGSRGVKKAPDPATQESFIVYCTVDKLT
jgi:hypothetical protein